MGMPGFTATNSLAPSNADYYGGRSLSFDTGEMVRPEFLGVIKEAFESVGHGLSNAVQAGASALASAIQNINSGGGPGGTPFVCGQWATTVIACWGNTPTFSEAMMLARCVTSNALNPAMQVACASVTAGLYPLVKQACADGSDVGQIAGQVCGGA